MLASACAEQPPQGQGCLVRQCRFFGRRGYSTAAALAGGQGGHLPAPLNEGSLLFGRGAGEVTKTVLPGAEARRKGDAFCRARSAAY